METPQASGNGQEDISLANANDQGQLAPLVRIEKQGNASCDDGRPQVDPGAFSLAAIAAAAAVLLSEGDWDVLDSVVGVILIMVFLAHHRATTGPSTVRTLLLRGVFGGTVAIALGIMLASPLQKMLVEQHLLNFLWSEEDREAVAAADRTTSIIAYAWLIIAPIVALFEPRISAALNKNLSDLRIGWPSLSKAARFLATLAGMMGGSRRRN